MKTALAAEPSVSTLASRIYESLLQRILDGEFAPGARLEENVLAEQFGVSRTPVREALRELGARKLRIAAKKLLLINRDTWQGNMMFML